MTTQQPQRPTWAQDDVWGYVSQLEADNADLKRQLAEAEPKYTEMLNTASEWRNRAINAEEELAGTNRLRRIRALKGESK